MTYSTHDHFGRTNKNTRIGMLMDMVMDIAPKDEYTPYHTYTYLCLHVYVYTGMYIRVFDFSFL